MKIFYHISKISFYAIYAFDFYSRDSLQNDSSQVFSLQKAQGCFWSRWWQISPIKSPKLSHRTASDKQIFSTVESEMVAFLK